MTDDVEGGRAAMAQRLGDLLHDVSRLRRNSFDRQVKRIRMTRSQWWVLAHLSREDGLTQTRLAESLDVGKVAIGALIDRLETAQWVRRAPDDRDRRVKRVYLTPAARPLFAQLRRASERQNRVVADGIGPAALETLAAALLLMKRNLDRFLKDDGEPAPGQARS